MAWPQYGGYDPNNDFSGAMLNFGQNPGNFNSIPMAPAGGYNAPVANPGYGMTTGTGLTASNVGSYMPPQTNPAAGAGVGTGKFGNFMNGFANFAEGLSGLANIYLGMKSLGLAKDQFAFSKKAYETNLKNTTQSYNTALEDRIRSRYVTEGRSSAEADAYLAKNNL